MVSNKSLATYESGTVNGGIVDIDASNKSNSVTRAGATIEGEGDSVGIGAGVAIDVVVNEIKEAGGSAVANYSDISVLDGVDAMMWTALSKFGKLDILINNAGILRDKTLLNMPEADWDIVMQVHPIGEIIARAQGNDTQGGR